MKRGLLGMFYFCALLGIQAQSSIGVDKLKHFGAGFAIGTVGGYTAHKIFKGNRSWMWVGAVGSSLAAGVLKENIDKNEYDGWDNNDILFTALGGAVSGLVLELLLKKNKQGRKAIGAMYHAQGIRLAMDDNIILIRHVNHGSHDFGANLQAQIIAGEVN